MNYYEKYALIIEGICKQIEPGKKMLQKLFYLMERKGVDLNLNYSIHFFGPYSSKLDNALHTMESLGIVNIDTTGMSHIINIINTPFEERLDPAEQEKVSEVLDVFLDKSPLELEALTTLDYVATRILKNNNDDHQIIDQVRKIKGSKFTVEFLRRQLDFLKRQGYITSCF